MELLLAGGSIDQILGGLHAGVHVGQLELGVLELAEAAAELDALLGVLHSLVHSASPRPRACAAMPIRPPSRVCMAILKPLPSLPSRFSFGNDAVLKDQIAGRAAADTHLLLVLAGGEAGKSFSTMNAEMPWLPLDLSVMAKTTKVLATLPLVMKHLEPLRT